MELETVLRGLRRRWPAILLVGIIAAAGTGWFVRRTPPVYVATAEGIASVANPTQRPPYAFSSGSLYILNRVTTYARLGVTTPVLDPVAKELHLQESGLTLSGRVTSNSYVGKSVVDVTVAYNDPKMAATIADATLAQLSNVVSSLEGGNIEIRPAGPAIIPVAPVRPNGFREAAVAGVAAMMLVGLLAIGLEYLSDRVRYLAARDPSPSSSAPDDA